MKGVAVRTTARMSEKAFMSIRDESRVLFCDEKCEITVAWRSGFAKFRGEEMQNARGFVDLRAGADDAKGCRIELCSCARAHR